MRLRWLEKHRTGNPGVILQGDKYFYVRDTGMYFRSSADGTLDIVSDTELTLTAPTITFAGSTAFGLTGDLTLTGELVVGVSDTGHDVKFFGATADNYLHWDESGDDLLLVGTATQLAVAGDTDASSSTTGSLRTAGGLGVAKKAYIGTDLVMVGGDIDLTTGATGTYDIALKTNMADALSIKDSAADLIAFKTTTGAPGVTITPDTLVTGNLACSSKVFQKNTTTSKTSAASVTYTAAEIVGGYIVDTISEACAATTATGTELVAAVPNCVDGSSFLFILKNAAGSAIAITLGGGTDVTVTGTATVGQNNTKVFLVVITSVASHTATFYSIGTMVH